MTLLSKKKQPLLQTNNCLAELHIESIVCVGNLVTFTRNDGMTWLLDLSKVVEGSNVTNFELLPDDCTLRITTDQAAPNDTFDLALPGLVASGSVFGASFDTLRLVDSCSNNIDIDLSTLVTDADISNYIFGTASTDNILRIVTPAGNFDLDVTNMLVSSISYDKAAGTLTPTRPDGLALTASATIKHVVGRTAWVDLQNGSDVTGTVGREDCPYLTVHTAALAAHTAFGGNFRKWVFVGPGIAQYNTLAGGGGAGTDDTGTMHWAYDNMHLHCTNTLLHHVGDSVGDGGVAGTRFFSAGAAPSIHRFKLSGNLSYTDERLGVFVGGSSPFGISGKFGNRIELEFNDLDTPPIGLTRWRDVDISYNEAIFHGGGLAMFGTGNLDEKYFRMKGKRTAIVDTPRHGFKITTLGTVGFSNSYFDVDPGIVNYDGVFPLGLFEFGRSGDTTHLRLQAHCVYGGAAIPAGALNPLLKLRDASAQLDVDLYCDGHPGPPIVTEALLNPDLSPSGQVRINGTILPVDGPTAARLSQLEGRLRTILHLLYDFSTAGVWADASRDGCIFAEDCDRRNTIEGAIRLIEGTSGVNLWYLEGNATTHCQLKDLTMETDSTFLALEGSGFVGIPLVYVKNVDSNKAVEVVPLSPVTYIGPHVIEVDPDVQA